MKLIYPLSIALIASALFVFSCGDGNKPAESLGSAFINANGGLRMRDKPDLAATRILTIPNGAEVELLEKASEGIVIDGRFGFWTKVKFENQSGWVFGAYLSDSPPKQESLDLVGKVAFIGMVSSDTNPANSSFRIEFVDRDRFTGYCEGYSMAGSMSGKWESSGEDFISLRGTANMETCADGPALEDESLRCSDDSSAFTGKIKIKQEDYGIRILEYISETGYGSPGSNVTPCGATVVNGAYSH